MDRTSSRSLSLSSTSSSTLISMRTKKSVTNEKQWKEGYPSGVSSSEDVEQEGVGIHQDPFNEISSAWSVRHSPYTTQLDIDHQKNHKVFCASPTGHENLADPEDGYFNSVPDYLELENIDREGEIENGLDFYQSKKKITDNLKPEDEEKGSFSTSLMTHHRGFPRPSSHHHSQSLGRFKANNSGRNVITNRALVSMGVHNKTGVINEPNFVSSNIYLRPLPSSFTPLDLHELCMSMVLPRSRDHSQTELSSSQSLLDSRLILADDSNHLIDSDLSLVKPATVPFSPKNDNFRILSVKVMIEEEDHASLGFGFCLWNSVEASTRCIEGLRAHGYQASYARESSRGMLSSLADPTSANIYLSNLPFHWGEDDLKNLFGETPIASARLLRDRDDEAVGSGASRGVGFVRLACRSDALHFVELLHGMPIPGTKCHLQCRMADSQAQKEWKRNVRSSFKPQLALEPPATLSDLPPTGEEGWSRDRLAGASKTKWRGKKIPYKSHSTPANYMIPSDRRRGNVARASQPTKNGPTNFGGSGFEMTGGGGFPIVGLAGSPGAGFLMPGFHHQANGPGLHGPGMLPTGTAGVSPPGAHGGAHNDQGFQPMFPLLPVYPPGGWYQGGTPGMSFSPSSDASPADSSGLGSPMTPAKFPASNWPSPAPGWPSPAGEFFEKSTAYYYYHHHEVYQPNPHNPHHLNNRHPPGSVSHHSEQKPPLDTQGLNPNPTGAPLIQQDTTYSIDTQTTNSAPMSGPLQPIVNPIDHHHHLQKSRLMKITKINSSNFHPLINPIDRFNFFSYITMFI
ncbi:hypothetical protein H4Q26_006403 [Puccinia striiformis f. sp. tritici PST-130]|nr:hypothetical protein H4Q26_006403 [Puccinia striiformis f. sp. tritici PST-130]